VANSVDEAATGEKFPLQPLNDRLPIYQKFYPNALPLSLREDLNFSDRYPRLLYPYRVEGEYFRETLHQDR
jgi:hypothetical protein